MSHRGRMGNRNTQISRGTLKREVQKQKKRDRQRAWEIGAHQRAKETEIRDDQDRFVMRSGNYVYVALEEPGFLRGPDGSWRVPASLWKFEDSAPKAPVPVVAPAKTEDKREERKKPSRSSMTRPAGPYTMARATYFFDLLSAMVPKRIANEEIGDAIEVIHGMVKERRPKWFIYLKVATTFWWVFVHTLLHYAERVAGIVKVVTGKSDKD